MPPPPRPGIIAATITISPTTVHLTPGVPPVAGQGAFSGTFTMSGLPQLTSFTLTAGDGNCPISSTTTSFATTATSHTVSFNLNNTAGTCKAGGHIVTLTSSGGTPFTAFVTFTS